jgi:hypothetical protein
LSRRLAQKGVPLSEQEAIALGIPAPRARALVARQAAVRTRAAAGTETQPKADATSDATSDAPPPSPAADRSAPAAPPPSFLAAGPRAQAKAAPPPAATTVPGMSDEELVALHRRYDEAARTTDRPAPSLARLKEQLAKRIPALKAQLGADRVTFEVAVKDGRVVLRPKPAK